MIDVDKFNFIMCVLSLLIYFFVLRVVPLYFEYPFITIQSAQ